MIQPGRYKAKAIEGDFGFAGNGREQVAVLFEVIDGDHKGTTITWFGFFTEQTAERTIESLIYAGWDGESETLDGLGTTEVSIVVEHDTYNGETKPKVAWVNRPGGGLALKSRMNEGQKANFGKKLRAKAASVKQRMTARGEDPESFNFGANDDLPPGL